MVVLANEDEALSALTDEELRYARKSTSMQQGHLEARLATVTGPERERVKRDMRHAATLYAKFQRAINIRLLGDEETEAA